MKNKKGFMLTETLVVSTLVSVVLVSLYIQFNTVVTNYNKSFKNDTVNDLYGVYYITNFFKKTDSNDGVGTLLEQAKTYLSNGNKYLEFNTSCISSDSSVYTLNDLQNCITFQSITDYYNLNDVDNNGKKIGRILFVNAKTEFTESDLEDLNDYNFSRYILSIKNNDVSIDDYRLIVKFDNLEYANLIVVE